MQTVVFGRESWPATSYKHICDCFEYINVHLKISDIIDIVQQYLHIIDPEYLLSLKPPIILKYAGWDDFLFQLGLKNFSGKIVWPHTSDAYILLDLDIAGAGKNNARVTVSVKFSNAVCEKFGTSIGYRALKFSIILGHENASAFVNTIFTQTQRPRLLSMLIEGCKSLKLDETELCTMLTQPIFDQACEMFHKHLIRAIYSEYHANDHNRDLSGS